MMRARPTTRFKLFMLILLSFSWRAATTATAAQQTRGVTVAKAPAKAPELPSNSKRYALVIGVDEYQDGRISRLEGAAADAQTLASALVEYAGFPAQQVTLLATNQPTDRLPTRGTILRRLSNLRGTVPPDGLLLLAFAGHGIERNNRAYLLPSDAQVADDVALLEDTAISVESVRDRITQTGVQQVILILDACRNDPTAGRGTADNIMSSSYTKQFNFDQNNKGITAHATLYATEVGYRAYEYREKKQGYFTWALIEGLKGGAADATGNVTLGSLVTYLQEVVPKRVKLDLGGSAQQRPFAVVSGYRAENLILSAPKPAAIAAVAPAANPLANAAPARPAAPPPSADTKNPLANPLANASANPLANPPATPLANSATPAAKAADAPVPKSGSALKVVHSYGVLPDHPGTLEVESGSLRYHEDPPEHDFFVSCKDFVTVRFQSRIADPKQEMVTLQLKNRASYSFRTSGGSARDQLVEAISGACLKK